MVVMNDLAAHFESKCSLESCRAHMQGMHK